MKMHHRKLAVGNLLLTFGCIPLVLGLGSLGCSASGQARANDKTSVRVGTSDTSSTGAEGKDESAETKLPDGFDQASVMEVVSTVGGHAVLLGDDREEMVIPIFVDEAQAMVIKLRLEQRRYSRPLTHDLLDKLVDTLDGKIVKVHIDAVKSGVFVGTVYVQGPDEMHEVDARSSDAVAVAIGHQAPIFVADQVFDKAGVSREELEQGKPQRPDRFRNQPDSGQQQEGENDKPFY